ncbi:putative unconventional myosin-XV isoform X2 [Apostichopus japonicus]|uniref:Putative unconventional myosin-XV isoform X2 n=1 Tax=Stichopus japonicus TaxID=307972 RepID=A0A2G8L316_STIJA|nr:putative unconventional myosin-XV isoform X2 [Apostichopus japonicus]
MPILRRTRTAAPPLPPRQEGMQRKTKTKGSLIQRKQEMLGQKKTVTVQPEVVATTALTVVTAAHVIRLKDYENIQTRLYKRTQGDYYGYHRVPWTIQVRKEVFIPGEIVNNNLVQELIFRQIVVDVHSNNCIRMTKAEKRMMRSLLQERDIFELNISAKMNFAPDIIEKARQLGFYFCRFFPVISRSRNLHVDYIGVSHHSVVLVQRSTDPMQDQLRTIESFEFSELRNVKATTHGNLRIITKSDSIVPLYTRRAVQLKNMIDGYITFQQEDSQFVRAIRDYSANESTLLSFQKGDVIKVTEHEVIKGNRDWLYGVLNGKTGFFPSQLVEPLAGQSSQIHPPVNKSHVEGKEKSDMPGRLSMEEFAMKHFREIPDSVGEATATKEAKGFLGSVKQSLRKNKPKKRSIDSNFLLEYKGLVSYDHSPIHVSLMPLEPEENNIAKDCFIALMQIMGDHPYQKRSADEATSKAVYRCFQQILKTVRDYEVLIDEIYCHVVKQTTHNVSVDSKSCVRGWRVLYVLSMFAKCSDKLKPYLCRHLEVCSSIEAENKYSAMANSALLNLQKTLKYGGRENLPSKEEIDKIMEGKLFKQQPFLIPESTQRSVRVKGNTLVEEAIRSICEEMNVVQEEDVNEFGILSITVRNKETERQLLRGEVYIMDAVSSKGSHTLVFHRVSWRRKLKIEREMLLSMLFHQV